MTPNKKTLIVFALLIGVSLACSQLNGPTADATVTYEVIKLPNSDEPVLVTGTVPFTSPFFLNSASEPFILLEDQAGFAARDQEYEFPLSGQQIGPVWQIDDNTMGFSLSLPAVPQGTLLDVDNDGQEDQGVMVFAVAYWANVWGGPFLEEREGTGWSSAHATTITDPERDYEITGGYLVIWAPDDSQSFPSGFGEDKMLFTEDDPAQPVPAGYSIVDLNAESFEVYKESNPEFELVEGSGQVKDYSEMSYAEAFDALFERVSVEYPFTADKNIDWEALYQEYAPQIADADDDGDFYLALRDFTLQIPDSHVGISINEAASQIFFEQNGGSFGLILAELSDGRIVVTEVLPGSSGEDAGIEVGAEITAWEGQPIQEALDEAGTLFGPYGTPQAERPDKLIALTRYPPSSEIEITFQNEDEEPETQTLTADVEYDSLFAAFPFFSQDPIELPIEAHSLEGNLVYIKINTFSDDYNLMAQIWENHIEDLIEEDISGLILDLRVNGGGNGGLARNFAGYFFDEEILASQHSYYNHLLGEFEYTDFPTRIEPGPLFYDGPVVVLVGPNCVSACEGFAYWMTLNDRATIVGHTGTAGAFGEVGRGQYELPGELSMQFPTGRPETPDGELLIEGVGILPDEVVPVTLESVLGQIDAVLARAIEILTSP